MASEGGVFLPEVTAAPVGDSYPLTSMGKYKLKNVSEESGSLFLVGVSSNWLDNQSSFNLIGVRWIVSRDQRSPKEAPRRFYPSPVDESDTWPSVPASDATPPWCEKSRCLVPNNNRAQGRMIDSHSWPVSSSTFTGARGARSSPTGESSWDRNSSHSIGRRYFLRLLQLLHANTTLLRLDCPPRMRGTM